MAKQRSKSDKILTDHHRRPTSIGGFNDHRNRSDVPRDIHGAWHDVVANLCAPEQAKLINKYLKAEGFRVGVARNPDPLHDFYCPRDGKCCITWYKKRRYLPQGWSKAWTQRFARRSRHRRRVEAWKDLRRLIALEIGDTSLAAAVDYINDHLTDADYYFTLIQI